MDDVALIPLSVYDTGLDVFSVTVGYMVKSVDCALLEAAAKRMINNWRLLAGRLEWSKELSVWCIRVPLKSDVSDRLTFTTSKETVTLDPSLTSLSKNSVQFVTRPPLKFFRHPTTHTSSKSFSTANAPIISIHVTEVDNCACVGISVPHGVFDAFGIGHIIRCMDAEMSGKDWVVPSLDGVNILHETVVRPAASMPPLFPSQEPAALAGIRYLLRAPSFLNILAFGIRTVYEYFWHKAETRSIYLGEAVVQKMVQQVKKEAEGLGSGWVSTGDVLVAWLLKAIYSKETDLKPVRSSSLVSMRSVLQEKEPAFKNYLHNCIMPSTIPPLSKSEIKAKSLTELAILHRQSIDAVRDISFIQGYNRWLNETASDGKLVVALLPREDSLCFSNQTIGHWDKVDFASEMYCCWLYMSPFLVDHTLTFKEFKGGYLFDGVMRHERWEAIAEAVEQLKALQ